ncbi:MAG TPA: hypothetical protein VN673_10615 [Clostridia bacterium]|nr:hypothetical protein [Clostridia bacterium]
MRVWVVALCLGVLWLGAFPSFAGLPQRLVVLLDGVSYQHVRSLQEGVFRDASGRVDGRQAFHHGYFPVRRLISTFPSASDIAWTEIFGSCPLPGYQRSYFSRRANRLVLQNGVTTTVAYERQMTWQEENGFRRAAGYMVPLRTYRAELREMKERFLSDASGRKEFYALLRVTDDAQHMGRDIKEMICLADQTIESIREEYRHREGRELEVLVLSDHGNNQVANGERIQVRRFLKRLGYRINNSIRSRRDVVMPTVGVESWVEIHCHEAETEHLASLLPQLAGVDIVTARVPGESSEFLVVNRRGERARISWDATANRLKYAALTGDPLEHLPVMGELERKQQLDANGFASAEAWMASTLDHRYPLALERIARGHTCVTLNPAPIIISLDNRYVHASWLLKKGSELVGLGGTHGGLDDLNSTGILLSNYAPLEDTSANRVAALCCGFAGLRDYRHVESGAEFVSATGQKLTRMARSPWDLSPAPPSNPGLHLRVWTPAFGKAGSGAALDVVVVHGRFRPGRIRRGDPPEKILQQFELRPLEPADPQSPHERVYGFPENLDLKPGEVYRITGRLLEGRLKRPVFQFELYTDGQGRVVAF